MNSQKILNRTALLSLCLAVASFGLASASAQGAEEVLFVAKPFTAEKSFTEGIEGPACDKDGNIYAVNFARQQTIGRITPEGAGAVFVELPGPSTGNGIVFDPAGTM